MASCRRTCKTSLLAGFVNTARIPQALAVGVCQRSQIKQFSFSRKEKAVIDEIVFSTLDYSASQLTEMTMHQKPWLDAYEHAVGTEISTEMIKNFFQELMKML